MTDTSPAVHRIEFSVDWTPGHVATYLVDAAETILFDAGTPGEDAHEELLSGLDAAGFTPSDIDNLVITHPHIDHIGQVEAILEAGSPALYAPASIAERFSRDADDLAAVVSNNAQEAGAPEGQVETAVEMSVRSLTRNRRLLKPTAVDHWLEPGEIVEIGGLELTAIHAPGHQADHLCFETAIGDEQVLFSGDMAIEPFRSVALHVGLDNGIEATIPAFYEALDRLSHLDVDTVYPGHGPVHEDFEGAITQSRESLDSLGERLTEMLEDGVETAVEVAMHRTTNGRDVSYLVPESYAALLWLEQDGKATSSVEDGVRRFEPAT